MAAQTDGGRARGDGGQKIAIWGDEQSTGDVTCWDCGGVSGWPGSLLLTPLTLKKPGAQAPGLTPRGAKLNNFNRRQHE
jgi:hypothetical protein